VRTRVQKWGSDLALRIPKSLAAETQFAQDAVVELSLVDGKLIVSSLAQNTMRLEQLLAGVTEDNLHGEWDTGAAVGCEVL